MRHLAHFICTFFGGGAVIFGVIGFFRGQWEAGIMTLCLGAAIFLQALIYDRTEAIDSIEEKLDLLLDQGRAQKS